MIAKLNRSQAADINLDNIHDTEKAGTAWGLIANGTTFFLRLEALLPRMAAVLKPHSKRSAVSQKKENIS